MAQWGLQTPEWSAIASRVTQIWASVLTNAWDFGFVAPHTQSQSWTMNYMALQFIFCNLRLWLWLRSDMHFALPLPYCDHHLSLSLVHILYVLHSILSLNINFCLPYLNNVSNVHTQPFIYSYSYSLRPRDDGAATSFLLDAPHLNQKDDMVCCNTLTTSSTAKIPPLELHPYLQLLCKSL